MSVFVVRAFVKLRQTIERNRDIVRRLDQLESCLAKHDGQILSLIQAIKQMMQRIRFRKYVVSVLEGESLNYRSYDLI